MRSIGLLTPYTGDNLGDGAIQEAVIRNVRARFPEVSIIALTLSPEHTARLHRVPCHPLTNLSIRYFSRGVVERHRGQVSRHHAGTSHESTIKRVLRRAPRAFSLARACYLAIGTLLKLPGALALQVKHVVGEIMDLPRAYRLVRGLDLLVASGGGQIDDLWGGAWGQPYAMLKWATLARLAKTPFVILSVGVGELGGRTSRAFMRRALVAAAYRSYRDQGSRQLLAAMPFTLRDPVCPDLAFSYPVDTTDRGSGRRGPSMRMGVNPISYLRAGSWPVAKERLHAGYLQTLASFIDRRLREGYEVVLFPGDRGDHHVIEELSRLLQDSLPTGLRQKLAAPNVTTVEDLIALLQSFDIVVASRLHSVILAHLLGVPVLAVSYERKVRTQMDAFGQIAYCVDIHHLTSADLDTGFSRLRRDSKDVQDRLLAKSREANAAIQKQYDFVLGRKWQP